MKPLWPHQDRGIADVLACMAAGDGPACLTSPTGGGKSRMMAELIIRAVESGMPVVLYTNRKLLLEQTAGVLKSHGIDFGFRASGYEPALLRDVQLSSIQTEFSRVYERNEWTLHPAKFVLIDEAHCQTGAVAQQIVKDHLEAGAFVLLVTATPIGLEVMCKRLIVAGKTSELRACGALLPCHTVAPNEPDLCKLGKQKIGEDFSEGELRKAIKADVIIGSVIEHYRINNPQHQPTILFASGVPESLWLAEHLSEAGIRAAHIDGENVWLDGQLRESTQARRDEILDGSRDGSIKIVCNRFVLREGIDMPHLAYCIMATVFGSLTSYLQAGGRLLRAHDGLTRVTLQDHGGNWWRHGSLNADRDWTLGITDKELATLRINGLREHPEQEPIHCPKCHAIRIGGVECRACGFIATKKTRMVLQTDGRLREMKGDIFKPRKVKQESNTEKLWEGVFWRTRKSGGNFNQAMGLFYKENKYWPPRNLPLMPKNEGNWSRKIVAVSFSDLHPKRPKVEQTPESAERMLFR